MLTQCIAQLDESYATSPLPHIYLISANRIWHVANRPGYRSRSTYYEQGDKAGRLLAHKLRQLLSSRQILKIRTSSGTSFDPREINDEFKRFYQSLYASENKVDISELDDFFQPLVVPKISHDLVEKLERPITVEELSNAIRSLQAGKSPGPDGYSAEFYKKFFPKIAPI